MLPLGTVAPAFQLPDTDGTTVSLGDLKASPALLVAFICNHCPYVKHVRHELAKLCEEYQSKGVAVVGISANDVNTHPDDSPKMMAKRRRKPAIRFLISMMKPNKLLWPIRRPVPRFLRLRQGPEARLSGPDGRQPAR